MCLILRVSNLPTYTLHEHCMNIEHERTNDPPVSASREMVWSNVFLIMNPRLADDRSAPGVFCNPSRVIQTRMVGRNGSLLVCNWGGVRSKHSLAHSSPLRNCQIGFPQVALSFTPPRVAGCSPKTLLKVCWHPIVTCFLAFIIDT